MRPDREPKGDKSSEDVDLVDHSDDRTVVKVDEELRQTGKGNVKDSVDDGDELKMKSCVRQRRKRIQSVMPRRRESWISSGR